MARALLVGRFQPFHAGHLATVRAVRAAHPDEPLILGIGSAQASYTLDNPFTAGERAEMIDRALAEAGVAGCAWVPLVDIDRHALWVAHLESLLPPFRRIHTNNPLTRLLFERAGYVVESPPLVDRDRLQGTRIRALLAAGSDVGDRVPPAVGAYLRSIDAGGRLKLLAARARDGGGGA
ncbi:MAG TPA: nicotinamide-nucleotide adenylyltransferase [Thermoplasmata archaeon]|nr:nicotinamide-nucleotide adenylyltransferase [Thermoplasmata archaeon]